MDKLDKDVLDWIIAHNDDEALIKQIRSAEIGKRDYMRTGYFIFLVVPADVPDIGAGIRPSSPHIHSQELLDGAGTTLFLKAGRLHYLEIYARGGFFPEQLREWQLTAEA